MCGNLRNGDRILLYAVVPGRAEMQRKIDAGQEIFCTMDVGPSAWAAGWVGTKHASRLSTEIVAAGSIDARYRYNGHFPMPYGISRT